MISVIIPAYNAEAWIQRCLNALVRQSIKSSKYEILVVDDGSIDGTAMKVRGFKGVRLLRQGNKGPAAARNLGAYHAKGDILLFTDSDCVPKKNWMEEMIRPFQKDDEVVGVKGAYRTKQRNLVARFIQIEYEDKYDLLMKDQYIDFIDTYSAAFKRELFKQFGGFDTRFPVACAEDVDLSFRIHAKGHKMVFNPKAIVYHRHPVSLLEYLKKKYKFAYWRMLAIRNNPKKIVKDSHTPQIMKLQLLLFPTLFGSLFLFMFFKVALLLVFGIVFIFSLFTLPFALKAFRKDRFVGFVAPFIMFCRSIFQFFGVMNGSVKEILLKRSDWK